MPGRALAAWITNDVDVRDVSLSTIDSRSLIADALVGIKQIRNPSKARELTPAPTPVSNLRDRKFLVRTNAIAGLDEPAEEEDEEPIIGRTRRLRAKARAEKKQKLEHDFAESPNQFSVDREDDTAELITPVRSSKKKSKRRSGINHKITASTISTKAKPLDKVEDDSDTITLSANLLKRKTPGKPVPKTYEEADEADLMMWEWRNNKREWNDIHEEWVRITGKQPGRSTLSVRYTKLRQNFAENSENIRDMLLLQCKDEAEQELDSQLWTIVASKMTVMTKKPSTARKLRMRYNLLKKNNWQLGLNDSREDDQISISDVVKTEQEAPLYGIASHASGSTDETPSAHNITPRDIVDVRDCSPTPIDPRIRATQSRFIGRQDSSPIINSAYQPSSPTTVIHRPCDKKTPFDDDMEEEEEEDDDKDDANAERIADVIKRQLSELEKAQNKKN